MRKIISIVLLLLLVSVFLIDAKNIKILELTSEKPLASQLTPEFADVDSLILVGELQDEDFRVLDSLSVFFKLRGYDISNCSLPNNTLPIYALSSGKRAYTTANGIYYGYSTVYYVSLPSTLQKMDPRCCDASTLKYFVIPNSVTSIGEYAFTYSSILTSIKLSDNIQIIPNNCFDHCLSLEHVVMPANCKYIMKEAFNETPYLKGLVLPNDLLYIGVYAFYNSGIMNIDVPGSVQEIDEFAFWQSQLSTVHLHEGLQTIGRGAFANLDNFTNMYCDIKEPIILTDNPFINTDITNAVLYVPYGSKEKYEAAQYWQDFGNIVEKDMSSVMTVKGDKQMIGVRYYNLAGIESAELQPGVDIEVTTYSDGTRTSEKVLK